MAKIDVEKLDVHYVNKEKKMRHKNPILFRVEVRPS